MAEALVRQGTLDDVLDAVSDAKPSVQQAAHQAIRAIAREGVSTAKARDSRVPRLPRARGCAYPPHCPPLLPRARRP